jgi:hypothetical protein
LATHRAKIYNLNDAIHLKIQKNLGPNYSAKKLTKKFGVFLPVKMAVIIVNQWLELKRIVRKKFD